MAGFKKEALLSKPNGKNGKGSFYGVHLDSKTVINPKIKIPAPPSDLIGPHISIGGFEPIEK